jgi:SAM-dependent methyltransferase
VAIALRREDMRRGESIARRVAQTLFDLASRHLPTSISRSPKLYYDAKSTIAAARKLRLYRVCEIGAGAGRYLAAILPRCAPSRYEVYEIDPDWASYLTRTYSPQVQALPVDGESLRSTPDASVGLVGAFGVFIYLQPLVALAYVKEMIRVVAPGGYIAFDFYPAEQVTVDSVFARWLPSKHRFAVWLPERLIGELLDQGGCHVIHRACLDFVWSRPTLVVARKRAAPAGDRREA